MKLYILPTKEYKPPKIVAFPEHSIGFNVETQFLKYLLESNILTTNQKADWHYLPIMWSYWLLSNNYGRDNRKEMQDYLNKIIIDDKKTFTVSEADNEPGFEIGETLVFSGNQSVGYHGHKWIPVPIITLPHQLPTVLPEKQYLSNFVGTIKPWKTRIAMVNLFKNRNDIKIIQNKKGEKLFVDTILESYSTLCPRGSALGSYRFYESMQLGVVPIMISDYDFRPFPDKIDWESCSYFTDDVNELPSMLDSMDKENLLNKGKKAKEVWNELFNKWPEYVLE